MMRMADSVTQEPRVPQALYSRSSSLLIFSSPRPPPFPRPLQLHIYQTAGGVVMGVVIQLIHGIDGSLQGR